MRNRFGHFVQEKKKKAKPISGKAQQYTGIRRKLETRIHQIQPTEKSKSQICISRHLLPPCICPCNGDALKGHDGVLTSTWDFPPSGCISSVKMIAEAVSLTMPGRPPYPSVFCFHLVTFDCKYPFWKKYQLLRGDQSDLRHLHLTLVPPPQCQCSVKTKQIWNVTLKTRQDEPDDYSFLRFTAWYPAQWNEQG